MQSSDGSTILTAAQISALPAGAPNEGEGAVATVNMLRALFLRHMSLLTDPSRSFVLASCGVNGRTIEALSKGASPELYNRVREAVTKIKAIAVSRGKSFGIGAILFDRGQWNYNPAYGGDGTREGWKSLFLKYYDDTVADFARGKIPCRVHEPDRGELYQRYQRTCDRDGPVGLVTAGGNVYGSGTTYQLPDKGGHLTSNGYRWRSQQDAKVAFRVLVPAKAGSRYIASTQKLRAMLVCSLTRFLILPSSGDALCRPYCDHLCR